MNFSDVLKLVLGNRKYFSLFFFSTVLFVLLFAFLFGLNKLPFWDFAELDKSVVWELFLPNLVFVLVSGTLNGLLLTITVFRVFELGKKFGSMQSGLSAVGFGLSGAFSACPFCVFSLASVFGASFVASYIAPNYFGFQLLALAVVLLCLFWTAGKIGKECDDCGIKTPE